VWLSVWLSLYAAGFAGQTHHRAEQLTPAGRVLFREIRKTMVVTAEVPEVAPGL
jgi:hypothetical protein